MVISSGNAAESEKWQSGMVPIVPESDEIAENMAVISRE
jgi:hypothetical protein